MSKPDYTAPFIVKGLDTILGEIGPRLISAPTLGLLEQARVALNSNSVALIPTCCSCKEPLDWCFHQEVVFCCPKCGKEWLKDGSWKERR